ncbi:MAG: 3'(2'),5'-bisphosphate nucleotidase CysQ [Acidimicrobiales bacterium]
MAAAIAYEAGQLLVTLQNTEPDPDAHEDHTPDLVSDQLIAARIAEAFPGDVILSEESVGSAHRLSRSRVWIVDPLDGSREYGEARADWAVHVGLLEAGKLVAGAVALPGRAMLFSTTAPFRRPVATGRRLRLAVSRTRPPGEAQTLVQVLGAELVPMGSAGAKAMAVLLGEVDGYLHAGGQWEWDSAAPVAVALASGLHASRIDGSDFEWNKEHPFQPDLLICDKEHASSILSALSD